MIDLKICRKCGELKTSGLAGKQLIAFCQKTSCIFLYCSGSRFVEEELPENCLYKMEQLVFVGHFVKSKKEKTY